MSHNLWYNYRGQINGEFPFKEVNMPKLDLFLSQDLPYPGYVEMAQLAEEHGFENLWLIDSPEAYYNIWAAAAVCAVNTSRIRIGPGVTNPLSRHPQVTANAALTIHDISGGRAILGLGAGDSAVRQWGGKPVTVSVMREAIEFFQERFKEKGADIPIYLAVGGPKMTALACEKADGIIGGGGGRRGPQGLQARLEQIKAVAKEVGRDMAKLPVEPTLSYAISHDRREAMDDMRGPIARGMKGIFIDRRGTWPTELEHLRADAERVAEAYDYKYHQLSHVPHAELVTDALVEEFGLAGTPEEVLPKFKALWQEASRQEAAGVDITFQIWPAGRGRKRSFELFIQEILPQLG